MKQGIFLLAIAGGTASGKSTLTRRLIGLAPAGRASVLLTDNYYRGQDDLTLEERGKTNYDRPQQLEFDLLLKHLHELKAGRPVEIPIYDYSLHTRTARTELIAPTRFMILDGILCLYPDELRALYDYSVFVDAPEELRFERRMARDIAERGRTEESVIRQWADTVKPMHDQYCQPTSRYADEIVDGSNMTEFQVLELWQRIETLAAD